MLISKRFHFYAAHRNQNLTGKCASIHGHRYGLEIKVLSDQVDQSGVSILFEDIEKVVAPVIEKLDHSLLLDLNDPAKDNLVASGACSKIAYFNGPTSAENIAKSLMLDLITAGLNVISLILQETDSSSVTVHQNDLRG